MVLPEPPELGRGRVLVRPIRGRATFAELRRAGTSRRAGPVTVITLPAGESGVAGAGEVRLGFAIGRKVGGAVVRNRLRRRLRAAAGELAPPPGAYLVIARPEAAALPYGELRGLLRAALPLPGLDG